MLKYFLFISFVITIFIFRISCFVANQTICPIEYSIIWSFTYAHAPFLCSPVISDLDGDLMPDIVGNLASGDVIGIHGESGHVLDNWSIHFSEVEFHSAPILFDLNEDGLNDVIFFGERGKILFVYSHAENFILETIQIPPLKFNRYWFLETDIDKILVDFSKEYLSQNSVPLEDSSLNLGIVLSNSSLVSIPPHIHSTPLLTNIELDSVSKDLIIPLSFYFVPSDYFNPKKVQLSKVFPLEDINKYLVEAILVLNPYRKLIVQFKLLSVSMLDSLNPTILLSTPVIFNFLKNNERSLIVASISGNLYKITIPHFLFASGFPVNLGGSISHTPLIYDIDGDGSLEIFIVNDFGDVISISRSGQVIWKISLESKLTDGGGLRMARLDEEGTATLITASQNGMIYAIDPQTGHFRPNYPIATGVSLTSLPLMVSLSSNLDPVWILISDEGELVLYSHKQRCSKIFQGSRSLISRNPIIYYNLVDPLPGLELLISSDDGTLTLLTLSIMDTNSQNDLGSVFREQHDPYIFYLDKWESPLICQIQNLHRNISLSIIPINIYDGTLIDFYRNYMIETFTLNYLIMDKIVPSSLPEKYFVEGRVGEIVVFSTHHYKQGSYWITFPFSSKSLTSTLSVYLNNEHGIYDCIHIPVSFNLNFKYILKWLLLLPFACLIVVLLILHLESGVLLPNYIR